jgi:anti-sigma28 factor (negative regulator of flagellin synthesis)
MSSKRREPTEVEDDSMKTRFQQELSGDLGEFWQRNAKAELEKVKADLRNGEITIDENGVARNCIGRALMDDLMEKLVLVTEKADSAATQAVREAEVQADLASYRARRKTHSAEEIDEMRATFGAGAKVVDFLTGDEIEI